MQGVSEADDQAPYCFAPFRFDPASGELWSAGEPVRLRPKTAAVLGHLLERRGRVVTREELCRAVWPRSHGSEQAPKQCIRELRIILGDTASEPRFIETVGRRGYRFIAPGAPRERPLQAPGERAASAVSARICVGREAELATLAACLDRVRQGERQVVFVTGEAGIGKTALIEHFIRNLSPADLWVATGQCLPHRGAAEVYGPLLDGLDQLARGAGGAHLVALLERCAPTWLLALPGLAAAGRRATADTGTHATSPERMRRELVEVLAAFSADRLGILVLEDLHWSDTATLDWLLTWAARPGPGRVLVVGSFRLAEVVADEHPLPATVHALSRNSRCRTLALTGLGEDAVAAYLRVRAGDALASPELGRLVQRRTEGHPLFLTALVDEWQARDPVDIDAGNPEQLAHLVATVPATVRALIEHQFRGLSRDERRLLETASVAGLAFPAAAVAAGLRAALESVEDACAGLVARHLFLASDDPETWPDGTVTACYAFRHVLYRQVVYDGLPAGRRAGLHRRVGERLETGYGADARQIAVRLAEHFVEGGDPVRAVRYLRLAGETALARQAHRDAREHLQRGLAQIERCPEGPQRRQEELRLQTALAAALIVLEGFAAPSVASAYRRAYRLSGTSAQGGAEVPTLCGLWNYLVTRGDLRRARSVSKRLLEITEQTAEPALWLPARNAVGQTHFFMGEPAAAIPHIDAVLERYDPTKHQRLFMDYGEDPGVVCHMYGALTRWLLGYPEQAQRHLDAGLALAARLAQPFGLAQMSWMAAVLAQCVGDAARVREHATVLGRLCREHEIGFWLPGARVLEGWALAAEGHRHGTAIIREGVRAWRSSGAKIFEPYHLALLACAEAGDGNPALALASLDDACAQIRRSGERWYAAELARLQVELGRRQAEPEAGFAENRLVRALALARRQGARALALRAATSLARLWLDQGRCTAAYALLAPSREWFTEGLDAADLREAGALLGALAPHVAGYQQQPASGERRRRSGGD